MLCGDIMPYAWRAQQDEGDSHAPGPSTPCRKLGLDAGAIRVRGQEEAAPT